MAISAGDIKLLASDTMSDVPEGGGAVTGNVIVDGLSNNIFDDISTLDRVYGAVHMRKVFPAVTTQTRDKFFGAHVIISKLPGDGKIGVNLFNTGDYFDRRPSAQSRVENYRAQGSRYNGFLWGTQYKESRVLTIYQRTSAPLPGIGDVLGLVSATASQYVRIVKLNESIQEFSDNATSMVRRILEIELSDVLHSDFAGTEITGSDPVNPPTVLYKTVVANAARYYSARLLAAAASIGDRSVRADSVYSQVVPSSQSETALVDVTAGGHAAAVVDSAHGAVSFTTSVAFSPNSALYLGSPCLPGSLSIPVSGGTIVDNAGTLKIGSTAIGTVNYTDGTLTFAATSPTYGGNKTVTFTPAAAPVRLADSTSIAVTAANRGFVWTLNISPAPKPMSVTVAYRALNQWYELSDNGAGGIVGSDAGIGSGTVNYLTGSVAVTLAVLPDVGSEIIFSWGTAADFTNRSNLTLSPFSITKVLDHDGVIPATLIITWNDGSARTLTCNAMGVLSGHGSGKLNTSTNTVEFAPSSLPAGGTDFSYTYDYGSGTGALVTESFANAAPDAQGNLVLPLTHEPYPGTLSVEVPTLYRAIDQQPPLTQVIYLRDDGAGTFGSEPGAIDYSGKSVTVPNIWNRGNVTGTPDYMDMPFLIGGA